MKRKENAGKQPPPRLQDIAAQAQVSIGTVVTIRTIETGAEITYTILGAWDGMPEKNIISYLTAIGQALLGHKPGEQIDVPTEHGTEKVEVVSIEAYQPAATAAV